MKRIAKGLIVLAGVFTLAVACKEKPKTAQELEAISKQTTEVVFDKVEYNFDTIQQGDKVKVDFEIRNVGKHDLKIEKARATCGCTVPNWPKEFIKPGEARNIHVVFNSAHKSGRQNKAITIFANVPGGKEIVKLKGFVKTEKKENK